MSSPSAFGNVGIIANRAQLRSGTAAGLPPCILLQGTTTPLDGGQGFYAVSLTDKTTPDDGTNCIVDGAGYRWFLITADTGSQIMAALIASGAITSNVSTWLATPSSANLRGALTDETGTGVAVFNDSPALITPDLGTPSALVLTNASGYPVASAAQSRDTTNVGNLLTPKNLLDVGAVRVLFYLLGADMNSTADQVFTKNGTFTSWMIGPSQGAIKALWKSGPGVPVTAGGIYTGAGKTGDTLMAAGSSFAALTAAGTGANNSPAALGSGLRTDSTLYFSLTTGAGFAQTADIYILGVPLS